MRPLLLFLLCAHITALSAQTYTTLTDLSNRPAATDTYAQERCRLDLYYPTRDTGFATIVYFHGGGLRSGEKHFPAAWREQGIAVVAANYRLHPRVANPTYTEDAAAAVAWTLRHIAEYGGDPRRVFVGGHSAGGYLTSMVGLDTTYLGAYGLHPDSLAGLLPFSGHTITHFTPREAQGLAWHDVRVDRYAPIAHLRPTAPPIWLITGDRELELWGRYEENAYCWRMLRLAGHPRAYLHELDGFDHGSMVGPATLLALRIVREEGK